MPGWLVMGGMMVAGIACTFLAQREWTELKELQDDRLARKNADCLAKQNSQGLSISAQPHCGMEFGQNQRADGKTWEQAVAKQNSIAQPTLH